MEGCPTHCRIFSSILGLYPLDTSNVSPSVVITKNISKILPNVCWRAKSCWLKTTGRNLCPSLLPSLRTTLMISSEYRKIPHPLLYVKYNSSQYCLKGLTYIFMFSCLKLPCSVICGTYHILPITIGISVYVGIPSRLWILRV